MLGGGVDPGTVMESLSRSQISVTMNTCSHVPASVSRAAVEGVSSGLNEGARRAQAARMAARSRQRCSGSALLKGAFLR